MPVEVVSVSSYCTDGLTGFIPIRDVQGILKSRKGQVVQPSETFDQCSISETKD